MTRVTMALASADINACWAGFAALLLVALLWVVFNRRRKLSPRRRVRLAVRQDINGRRLLQMANELDQHARELRLKGMPAQQAQRWAGQCRTLAAAHLACITALLLDPRVTREIIQDLDPSQRGDSDARPM